MFASIVTYGLKGEPHFITRILIPVIITGNSIALIYAVKSCSGTGLEEKTWAKALIPKISYSSARNYLLLYLILTAALLGYFFIFQQEGSIIKPLYGIAMHLLLGAFGINLLSRIKTLFIR